MMIDALEPCPDCGSTQHKSCEEFAKLAHISNEEIWKDIRETEAEIDKMTGEADYFEATPSSLPETRWNHIRAQQRRLGIAERKTFIDKLYRPT